MALNDTNFGQGSAKGVTDLAANDSVFTTDLASATRIATSAPFAKYLTEQIWENSVFVASGILGLDSRLNGITGTRVEIPFHSPLADGTEQSIRSDNTWGAAKEGYLVTRKGKAETQYCPYVYRGDAYSMDKLSTYQTGRTSWPTYVLS